MQFDNQGVMGVDTLVSHHLVKDAVYSISVLKAANASMLCNLHIK